MPLITQTLSNIQYKNKNVYNPKPLNTPLIFIPNHTTHTHTPPQPQSQCQLPLPSLHLVSSHPLLPPPPSSTCTYLHRTPMTRRLHLDTCQYRPVLALCAFLLLHLALWAELLEHHFRVAAFVRVGVVETHFGCGMKRVEGEVLFVEFKCLVYGVVCYDEDAGCE
jgi:hypothetical protein